MLSAEPDELEGRLFGLGEKLLHKEFVVAHRVNRRGRGAGRLVFVDFGNARLGAVAPVLVFVVRRRDRSSGLGVRRGAQRQSPLDESGLLFAPRAPQSPRDDRRDVEPDRNELK